MIVPARLGYRYIFILWLGCQAVSMAGTPGTAAEAAMLGAPETEYHNIRDFPKWTRMLEHLQQEEQQTASVQCKPGASEEADCRLSEWRRFLASLQSKQSDRLALLRAVNDYANAVTYAEDNANWKKSDYWSTPIEFFQRGKGDCEDYAIAKYVSLKKLGFSEEEMRIVIVNDTAKNIIHAVLAVNLGGTTYILDNQNPNILPDQQLVRLYDPIFSINTMAWWKHVA